MRVMFLLLLLANLMFFGWANWVDRPAARVRAANPVPALQLAPGAASGGAAPAAAASAPARCRSLGPWSDEAAANAAGAVLGGRGLQPAVRRVDSSVADGYWVYIAAADAAEQRRVLRQLGRAGVRDAAVVGEEAGGGRVSTGVFTDQKGAEERAAAVRRAGLEPVLEERHKSVSAWWLDVPLAAGVAEPRADDAALAAAGAALQWSDCPK
ncbi:MAG: hypothetical protein U1F30_05575 [Steroidobacteraceae bacterium]